MADEKHTFAATRTRLEEIVVQVRRKDTSLEQSLDLLEEGVRLANVCTELSDHTEWRSVVDGAPDSTALIGDGYSDDEESSDEKSETDSAGDETDLVSPGGVDESADAPDGDETGE